MSESDGRLGRRDFLRRAAKAGAIAAGAGVAGALLWRPAGTTGRDVPGGAGETRFWDFRVQAAGPRLAIVQGLDRDRTAQAAIAALGGIERFVRPGDRVLLKVNGGFAVPAPLGACIHPDTVTAVVRLCLGAGAAEVMVTDNPTADPESAFRVSGITDAAGAAGARLVLPRAELFRPVTLPGGELLREWPVLAGPLDAATKVIGLVPVKDHGIARATLSVKNLYGVLGGRRNLFHQRMDDILVELAQLVRPTFVLLDGTMTMMRNGPTGGSLDDLKPTATMIASTDPIAADAFGATLVGHLPGEFPWMTRAAAAVGGTTDWESLSPVRGTV